MIHMLERIHERHPEIDSDDVREAWDNAITHAVREDSRPFEYLAVGFEEGVGPSRWWENVHRRVIGSSGMPLPRRQEERSSSSD